LTAVEIAPHFSQFRFSGATFQLLEGVLRGIQGSRHFF
jgi:hypothetical protein